MRKKITLPQVALLRRVAAEEVYVYSDPAKVGGGVAPATLRALTRAGLVTLGPYKPLRGRRLVLTDTGRAVLDRPADGEQPPTPATEETDHA